jgi:hypothetical protein
LIESTYKNGFSDLRLFADSGGSTELILDTDFELGPSDTDWTSDEIDATDKVIYPQFKLLNALYFSAPLWATFTNFGVYTSADAVVNMANRLGEMPDFPFSITDSGVQDLFSTYGKYAVYCNGAVIDKSTNTEYTALVNILKAEASGDSGHPFYAASADQATLPDARGRVMRALDPSGTIDPDGAGRDLGDFQEDAMQRITGEMPVRGGDVGVTNTTPPQGANGVFDVTGTTERAERIATTGGAAYDLGFDSSLSTSPNAAKTNDLETHVKNMAVNKIIFYV